MALYVIQQLVEIVELFYENGPSVQNMYKNLLYIYRQHNHLSKSTIKWIVNPQHGIF